MIDGGVWKQLIFWGVWLVIPLIWELLGGLAAAAAVGLKLFRSRKEAVKMRTLAYHPVVSIFVPVYNSSATLLKCLNSIADQDYPLKRLEVILIDNGSSDDSFTVFKEFQEANPGIRIWWQHSEQGKSKALNMGVFSANGKYMVNIDSDGWLDKYAISSMTAAFEADGRIHGMTGVVLIDHSELGRTVNKFIKILGICELFEYIESFLIGRSFQSLTNSMHTMAGAFSCYRREAIMKTQLYNSETLGEDAHMTRQLKDFSGGKVVLCENAFYYTGAIRDFDQLYAQRQRWQRAELEVAALFSERHLGGILSFITKPSMRRVVSDHTMAFPRMIWIFAMIYLYFMNYPLILLAGANFLLYAAYVISGILNVFTAHLYLKQQGETERYVMKHFYFVLLMPVYRFIIYWIRLAGIINSLTMDSKWRTRSFRKEIRTVDDGIRSYLRMKFRFLYTMSGYMNRRLK